MRKAEAEKQPDEKEPLKVSDVFSESESEESSMSSSDDSDSKELYPYVKRLCVKLLFSSMSSSR